MLTRLGEDREAGEISQCAHPHLPHFLKSTSPFKLCFQSFFVHFPYNYARSYSAFFQRISFLTLWSHTQASFHPRVSRERSSPLSLVVERPEQGLFAMASAREHLLQNLRVRSRESIQLQEGPHPGPSNLPKVRLLPIVL